MGIGDEQIGDFWFSGIFSIFAVFDLFMLLNS